MTQPIPKESLDYEQYVDGLRIQIQVMTSIAAAREKQFAAARKERDALKVINADLVQALEMYLKRASRIPIEADWRAWKRSKTGAS